MGSPVMNIRSARPSNRIPHGFRGFVLSTSLALGLGSGVAHAAQSVTHSASVPLSSTDWTQALDLPKFDPALGSLLAVSLSLDGLNETRTSVENQDTVPWSVVSGSDVTLRVLDLSGAELAALAPAVRFTNQLSESDGTVDFAGPSGIANPAQSSSLSVRRDYSVAADDLSGFIGLDSLGLSASAHGQGYYDGPGDYCFLVRTKASLTATLVYTFEPPAPVVIPAPLPPVVVAAPRPAPALGSIGDRVWLDLDANGTQDSAEKGLAKWTVQLVRDGAVVASQPTGSNGDYLFANLPAATYTVRVVPQAGFLATFDADGLKSRDAATLSLGAGENRRDLDFGYVCRPVNRPHGNGCGSKYWGTEGWSRVCGAELAELSAFKLVDPSGRDLDFIDARGGNFGAGLAHDLDDGCRRVRDYLQRELGCDRDDNRDGECSDNSDRNSREDRDLNTGSMASKLSAHLALFHLNLGNGFIKPTDWVKTPGIASGRCHPADLLDLAQAELLKNPCTPKSHKSRAYQQSLKIALESANRTACR